MTWTVRDLMWGLIASALFMGSQALTTNDGPVVQEPVEVGVIVKDRNGTEVVFDGVVNEYGQVEVTLNGR